MECVEAVALKSSRKEMMVVVKQSPPQLNFLDDFNCMQNGAVSSDDFFVDELLDFSNEDGFGGGGGCAAGQGGEEEHLEREEEEEVKTPRASSASASVSPIHEITLDDQNNNHLHVTTNSVGEDDFVMIPATELCVLADDVASLEWLSHFVEDSNSEYSTPFPVGASPAGLKKEDRSAPGKQVLSTEPCFKTPFPGKARSKRTRTGVRVWPLLGSPSLTESSSSPTTSSSSSCPSSPWLIYTNTGPNFEPVDPEKPVFKKQNKTQVGVEEGHGGGTQTPRRCSHCGVQKTPQWRTGPLGAKTLCNACGVRYKSGRLLPEYRPACSPTFSSELHSNHHRKVLEMRKKKEPPVFGQPELGLGQGEAVPNFG